MAELMVRLMKVCALFGYSYPNVIGALSTEDTSSLTPCERNLYNNFVDRWHKEKAAFHIYDS